MVQNDPMCIRRSKRATASWISASNLTGLLILLVLYASFLLVRYFILCPKVWQAQCHLLSYILVYFISKSQLNCLLLLEVFPNPVQRDMISSCVCLMLLNYSFSAVYYNNDACFSFPLQCFDMPSSKGIFTTQGSNPRLLRLLHWQAGFFTTSITWGAQLNVADW